MCTCVFEVRTRREDTVCSFFGLFVCSWFVLVWFGIELGRGLEFGSCRMMWMVMDGMK